MWRSTPPIRLFSTASASFYPRARGPPRIPATLKALLPTADQNAEPLTSKPAPPSPLTVAKPSELPGKATYTPLGVKPSKPSRPTPAPDATAPPPAPKKPKIPTPPTTFELNSLRWDQPTPTESQLSHADRFFQAKRTEFKFGVTNFRDVPYGEAPEVVILGRSNVGKSTLLNKALCTSLAHSSQRPGRTRTLNGYAVNGGRIVVLDMPGYGHGSKMAWGAEILKYLGNRRVFRRVFLLIDAMVGINKKDVVMIEYLKTLGISFQVVVNKCDKIAPGELRERMEGVKRELERVGATNVLGEILGVSAEPKKKDRRKFGVDAFRWAVLKACGLENEEAVIKDLKVEIKVDKEVKGEKKKAATPRKEKEWVYTKVEREKKEKEEREREERALEEEEWEEEMEERREREASRGRPKYRK